MRMAVISFHDGLAFCGAFNQRGAALARPVQTQEHSIRGGVGRA